MKAAVEGFNNQPKAARSIILERLRDNMKRDPGEAEKLIMQQIGQGKDQDRGISS